jgi:flap endonuclease-1
MGVKIGDLVIKEKIEISDLKGKTVAIDAYNTIYQFLTTIRQKDGTPLMNSKGITTSHLSGLFHRSIKLLENDVKIVYVFDGKPPSFKEDTLSSRREIKEDAKVKWEEALKSGNLEDAKKYAQMTSKLTPEMVEDAKELLDAMGIPHMQAFSEGEAQGSYMAKKGIVDYCASQDYDSLLFGTPNMIRNLTLSGRRKIPGRNTYIDITPEIINLEKSLEELKISREKLIWLCLMIGTDYNKGVNGIGPKKGYKIVLESESIEEVYMKSKCEEGIELWKSIEEYFLNPEVIDDIPNFNKKMNYDKVIEVMCDKNDFSIERTKGTLENFKKIKQELDQPKLGEWFK